MFYYLIKVALIIFYWLDFALLTLFMYSLSWLPKKLLKKWYNYFFTFWCKAYIRALNVKVYVHQHYLKKLPTQYIVIANHPSAFEDVGMPALFPARYVAKIELKDWFILGKIAKAANTIFVHRESKEERAKIKKYLEKSLNKGDSIGLYPEGGCKGRRINLPFHYGVFELAIKTGVPIIPVFIHYEAQENFEWQHQHLMRKKWQIITSKNPRANFHIYDPIDASKFKQKEKFCEHVENLYLEWQKQYLQ